MYRKRVIQNVPRNVVYKGVCIMKMTKKQIAAAVSAVVITSALAVGAGAAYKYSLSDVSSLQNALVGIGDIEEMHDANGDGGVNIFDLCTMKNELASGSGEVIESAVPVTEENVKFQGRYLFKDNTARLLQSGSAADFIVTGESASVVLAGDSGINSDKDYRPRYAVFVNGELIADKTMDESEETVTLFEGTTSQTAEVRVMMLSEASYGAIGVSAVNVKSSAAAPVKPAAENELSIEFIGDSITCAYGVEGASSSESFKTTTENFSKSYAYLAAQQLDADYSAVSYSGHGIVSGYSSGDKNSDALVPDYYTLASKYYEYNNEEWDFSKRTNDVVVINLGTNDINYVTAEFETRSIEFRDGYVSFLKQIREYNPEAMIVCTLGTMGGDTLYPMIEEAADIFREECDERIFCFESAVQNGTADGYGSDWHPSETTQINCGYIMADKICQALGIESSGLGLDAAADGTYDVALDEESGSNAAFYVGYDKSFWINMVVGGDSADDIEAKISGIKLRENSEYCLSFDYTTSVPTEMPVIVRGTDEYFTSSVSGSSEKQHFEETFTVSNADQAAEIVFQLGGTDYYNTTLYNVKLVKIS